MKKIIIAAIFGLISLNVARAQDMILTIDYNFGQTAGDFNEFISTSAYRGGGLTFTKFLEGNENIGVGMSIEWQGFYEKTARHTFPYYNNGSSVSNNDLNAVQFRYLYMVPILVSMDYYFIKDEIFLPYIGINAGMQYTEQELNVGTVSNRYNTAWDFAFSPEAGIHLRFGESGVGANLIGKYNMSMYNNTFDNIQSTIEMGSYWTVGLGLSFLMER